MIISQFPQVNGIPLYQTETPQPWDVTTCGQRFELNGGVSEVILVQAGAYDLAPGKLIQAPEINTAYSGLDVADTLSVVGANFINVTLGGTGITLNQFQGGFIYVVSGTGAGQKFTIQENLAAANGTTTPIILQDNTIAIALDTSSRVSLLPNPYVGAVVNPITATNSPIGVSFYTIPAGTFGYIATRGQWSCLNSGGTAIGLGLSPSTSVAGALVTATTGSDEVARATQAGVDTHYNVVTVNL